MRILVKVATVSHPQGHSGHGPRDISLNESQRAAWGTHLIMAENVDLLGCQEFGPLLKSAYQRQDHVSAFFERANSIGAGGRRVGNGAVANDFLCGIQDTRWITVTRKGDMPLSIPIFLLRHRSGRLWAAIVAHAPARRDDPKGTIRPRVHTAVIARSKHLVGFGLTVAVLIDKNDGDVSEYLAAGFVHAAHEGPDHVLVLAPKDADLKVVDHGEFAVEGFISDHPKSPWATLEFESGVLSGDMKRLPSRFRRPPKGSK